VADTLEADWNAKLRALAAAQERYEQAKGAPPTTLNAADRADLFALATDFPRLWRDPATSAKEKKRLVRLCLADVTLLEEPTTKQLTAHVRFRGGATRTLTLPTPPSAVELRRTPAAVVRRVDELLNDYPEAEIAQRLNQEGWRTGTGLPFTLARVARVRQRYGLPTRYARLRAQGLLDIREMAAALGVEPPTVKIWRAAGLLVAYPYSAKHECLYLPPGADRPRKHTWKGLSGRRRARLTLDPPHEV
jgi:hypothetical protein